MIEDPMSVVSPEAASTVRSYSAFMFRMSFATATVTQEAVFFCEPVFTHVSSLQSRQSPMQVAAVVSCPVWAELISLRLIVVDPEVQS